MSSDSPSTSNASSASLYIQPDIRRNRITILLNFDEDNVTLEIPELGITQSGQPGKNLIALEAYEQWSSATPVLYTLRATFESGTEIATRFAMREFTVKESRFFLNGRPLYIKGFDCSHWSNDTAPEAAAAAIDALANTGFNLVRVAPNELGRHLIEAADQRGMLVEVAFTRSSDLSHIEALRNHASIVAWDALHIPNADPDSIHSVDPSRLVYFRDSESNTTQLRRPYRDDPQDAEFFDANHVLVARRATSNYFAHIGHGEVLSYARSVTVNQFALNHDSAEQINSDIKTRELERLFENASDLAAKCDALRTRALARIIDALRTNANVAGYCLAGSVPSDPQRATALAPLTPHQGQTHLMVQVMQHNLVPRQETPVKVHFLNEDKLEGRADLSLQVIGPTNQVLWKKKRGVRLPKSGKLIWEGAIAASGSSGPHKFVVRVMQNMRCIAEASSDFHVYPPAKPWEKAIDVLDPNGVYKPLCEPFVSRFEFSAPVHIIPPLGNSIRAYPDNDLAQILGQVQAGSVALFFDPPADWNEFAKIIDPGLEATRRDIDVAGTCSIDYAKLHPVFDELPSRRLMAETYGEVFPNHAFVETSDEDISASLASGAESRTWSSNILVKRYGSGRIVFLNFSVLEHLGSDPVAEHLFVNLLRHFARRSVPSAESTLAVHQSSVEWLRQQRKEATRTWAVIGYFPFNPWGAKIPTYAPQNAVDLSGTYPGWHEAISWKSVYATLNKKFTINLDEILSPRFSTGPTGEYGIAYAYAEIHGDARGEMRLKPKASNPIEIYMNGSLVLSPESEETDPKIYLKQGKNTVLIKIYKRPGTCSFSLDLEPTNIPIKFRWWK